MVNSQIEQYNSGREKYSLDLMPFVLTPIKNNSDDNENKIMNFNLEQTLEYNRLRFRYNHRLEVGIQALMKIGHCFPSSNYTHMFCL